MIHATLFLWLALQSISPDGAQHMQAGVEAHKQGHLDVAVAEFRKALVVREALAIAGEDLLRRPPAAPSLP